MCLISLKNYYKYISVKENNKDHTLRVYKYSRNWILRCEEIINIIRSEVII